MGELTSAQGSNVSAQGALRRERERSAFARFFNNNEQSILAKISSTNAVIEEEKKHLARLSKALSCIKPILLDGAELYINGIRQ